MRSDTHKELCSQGQESDSNALLLDTHGRLASCRAKVLLVRLGCGDAGTARPDVDAAADAEMVVCFLATEESEKVR